jgi:hypothetical protein
MSQGLCLAGRDPCSTKGGKLNHPYFGRVALRIVPCVLVCAVAMAAPAKASEAEGSQNSDREGECRLDCGGAPTGLQSSLRVERASETCAPGSLWYCDWVGPRDYESVKTTRLPLSRAFAAQVAGSNDLRPLVGAALGGGLGLAVGAAWAKMEGEEFGFPAGAFFGGVGALAGGVSTAAASRTLRKRDTRSVLKSLLLGSAVGSVIWASAGAITQMDNRPGDAAKILGGLGFAHAAVTTAMVISY